MCPTYPPLASYLDSLDSDFYIVLHDPVFTIIQCSDLLPYLRSSCDCNSTTTNNN
ncbi:hypothetical protein INR49_005815 [Caranx melampygus]|nr:hypothetical protein INR49_005815 [Caranx melampygus]